MWPWTKVIYLQPRLPFTVRWPPNARNNRSTKAPDSCLATCSYQDIIVTTVLDTDRVPASILQSLANHGAVTLYPPWHDRSPLIEVHSVRSSTTCYVPCRKSPHDFIGGADTETTFCGYGLKRTELLFILKWNRSTRIFSVKTYDVFQLRFSIERLSLCRVLESLTVLFVYRHVTPLACTYLCL